MKTKKSRQADLNRFSSLFLWLGLVFVLFITWRGVEYKKYDNTNKTDMYWSVNDDETEKTFIVQKEQPKIEKPEPKKKIIPAVIVKTEKDPEPQTLFQGTETGTDDPIDPDNIETADNIEDDPEVPFVFVEQPPVFPGCEKYKGRKDKLKACMSKKIERFIKRKFDYSIGEEIGATGNLLIYVQFVVDKEGKISDIKVRSQYKELEAEAKRVISQLPPMKPGMQRGKPVNVRYNLPVKFRVN
jgi:protein TonB